MEPSSYDIVAIGGSAGGIEALIEIIGLLPGAFGIPILVVQHLGRIPQSNLATVLGRRPI